MSPPSGSLQGFLGTPEVLGTATCHKPRLAPQLARSLQGGSSVCCSLKPSSTHQGCQVPAQLLTLSCHLYLLNTQQTQRCAQGSTRARHPVSACRMPQQMTQQGARGHQPRAGIHPEGKAKARSPEPEDPVGTVPTVLGDRTR